MFLLDTNVVSELRVLRRADPNVVSWARSISAQQMYLSAISVLELEYGVLRLERRDRWQGGILRRWIDDQVLPNFAERVLAFDVDAALRCAALQVPDPRSERDAMIAATALTKGLTIVTRNVADFAIAGLNVISPWQPV
jgi:predicted nucleic acid-binding protein